MDKESRRMVGTTVVIALIAMALFFLGYGCGAGAVEKKYQKQTEIIQKVKNLLSGSV